MAKRGNGEGSVSARPRADGLWVARYTVIGDGVTRRPVVYGRTRQEASRKLRAALIARDESLKAQPPQGEQDDQQGHPPAPLATKYLRIVVDTPGGRKDVWVHPDAIESIEAASDDNTTMRLRSGRPLLIDQKLDAVLHDLGHSVGFRGATRTQRE